MAVSEASAFTMNVSENFGYAIILSEISASLRVSKDFWCWGVHSHLTSSRVRSVRHRAISL